MRRLIAASLAFAFLSGEADAYTTMTSPPSTWPRSRMPVPWYIHQAGSADLGIDVSERETRASFDNWQNVTCAYITFAFQGRTAVRAESSRGSNVISWTESGWRDDAYALAVTRNWYGRGTIEESDINCNGTTQTWNTTGVGGIDLQSVLTHEIGHFLGLGHSSNRGATMYASYSGGTGSRVLDADDIAGVCFLYPDESAGCTVDGDCPSGYHCEGGSCVRNPAGTGDMCAPCSSHDECNAGYCLTGFADGGSYCGVGCRSNADCPSGARCWLVTGGSSQCAPSDGDCAGFSPRCSADRDCPSGYHCEAPSCVPDATVPECTTDADCMGGYICDAEHCVPPNPMLRAFGEPCGAGTACQSGRCLDGYCTRSCPPGNPLGSCPGGYYCDDLSCGEGVCRRGGPGAGLEGEPCSSDGECASGYCETARGLNVCLAPCDPRQVITTCPAGMACQPGASAGCGVCVCGGSLFGDPCYGDADCLFGQCLAPEGEGMRCTTGCYTSATDHTGGQCPAGAACVSVEGPGGEPLQRCVAAGNRLGAGCTSNEACQSGLCAVNCGVRFCSRICNDICGCPIGMFCSNGFCTPIGLGCDEGCGCSAAGASRPAWGLLGFLALAIAFVLRPRRSPRAPL